MTPTPPDSEPETVSVTCADCGDTVELHPADAAYFASDEPPFTCESCRSRARRDRLISALIHDDDTAFTMADGAKYLTRDFPEAFPIRDDTNDRWILTAEPDRLDGVVFLGKMVTVEEGNDPCPECGDTRRRVSWRDNGIITGHRETCTVCDHVFSEDAG